MQFTTTPFSFFWTPWIWIYIHWAALGEPLTWPDNNNLPAALINRIYPVCLISTESKMWTQEVTFAGFYDLSSLAV